MAMAVFVMWCGAASAVDLTQWRLPNWITVPGAVGVLGYAHATGGWRRAWIGAAFLAVVYLAVHLIGPEAFGAGDVKLAVGLGAAAGLGGASTWMLAAVSAPVLTVTVGLVASAIRRSRHVCLPHGPSMCAATLVALVVAR